MRSSGSVIPPQDNRASIQVWKSCVKSSSPVEQLCCHWQHKQRQPDLEQEADPRLRPEYGKKNPEYGLRDSEGSHREEDRHISTPSRGHCMCRGVESPAATYPVIAWLQDCVSHWSHYLLSVPVMKAALPPSLFSSSRPVSLLSPHFSSIHQFPLSPFLPVFRIGLGVLHVPGKHSTTELHPGFCLPHPYRTTCGLSWHLSMSVEDQAGARPLCNC